MTNINIARGDIWLIDFDPTVGDEIKKIRPAVIISLDTTFRYNLRIVVPITGWQTHFSNDFWMIPVKANPGNGLDKDSAANAFQVKSISGERFKRRIGVLTPAELEEICTAIAFCIGYTAKP